MVRGLILSLVVAVPVAVWGAAQPSALSQVTGGLWEIEGAPGAKEPVRECVANVASLAQFEHRAQRCSRNVISDKGSTTVISYKCGAAGFGQSTVEVLTPRSLQISTQGISDQLPFAYVLQAHRVGGCSRLSSVTHH